jgi:hypothetical protein
MILAGLRSMQMTRYEARNSSLSRHHMLGKLLLAFSTAVSVESVTRIIL